MPSNRIPDYYGQMQNYAFSDPRYIQQVTDPNFGFYQFNPKSGPVSGDWKFHLSIDPKDVPKAWNIVVDELKKDNIMHTAKVTKPDVAMDFSDPDNIQAGKMITIYANNDVSPEHYKKLLQRIEDRFQDAGVSAGPKSNADKIIPGSRYGSYRRETGPSGEYVASYELVHLPREQRFNPWNTPDPYRSFQINNAAEIPRAPKQEAVPLPKKPGGLMQRLQQWVDGAQQPNGISSAEIVAGADWQMGVDRNQAPNRWVAVGNMKPQEKADLLDALKRQKFSVIERNSGLAGGGPVFAVYDYDQMVKLDTMTGRPYPAGAGRQIVEPAARQDLPRQQAAPRSIAGAPDVNSRAGELPWMEVTSQGRPARYLDVGNLNDSQVRQLRMNLEGQGLTTLPKESSLKDLTNGKVLAVYNADDIKDIDRKVQAAAIERGARPAQRAEPAAQPQQPARNRDWVQFGQAPEPVRGAPNIYSRAGSLDWIAPGTTSDGRAARYLDVGKLSDDDIRDLRHNLEGQGIIAKPKDSSLRGLTTGKVLTVTNPDQIEKLDRWGNAARNPGQASERGNESAPERRPTGPGAEPLDHGAGAGNAAPRRNDNVRWNAAVGPSVEDLAARSPRDAAIGVRDAVQRNIDRNGPSASASPQAGDSAVAVVEKPAMPAPAQPRPAPGQTPETDPKFQRMMQGIVDGVPQQPAQQQPAQPASQQQGQRASQQQGQQQPSSQASPTPKSNISAELPPPPGGKGDVKWETAPRTPPSEPVPAAKAGPTPKFYGMEPPKGMTGAGIGHTAAAGLGIGMGVAGMVGAVQSGNTGDMASAGANLATATANTGIDVAKRMGHTGLDAAHGVVGKLGGAVAVADGVYQISKEDGPFVKDDGSLGHKGERAVAVGTTAAVSTITATVLGTGLTVGGAAVATTGVAAVAVAAAPIVVVAATGALVSTVAENTIETRRVNEQTKAISQETHINQKLVEADKVNLGGYRGLEAFARLDMGLQVPADANGHRHLTGDQVKQVEHELDKKIGDLKKSIKDGEDNKSFLDKADDVLFNSTGADKKGLPDDLKLNQLEAVKKEMAQYKQNLAAADQKPAVASPGINPAAALSGLKNATPSTPAAKAGLPSPAEEKALRLALEKNPNALTTPEAQSLKEFAGDEKKFHEQLERIEKGLTGAGRSQFSAEIKTVTDNAAKASTQEQKAEVATPAVQKQLLAKTDPVIVAPMI